MIRGYQQSLLGVAGVQANEYAQSGYDKLLRGLELVRDGDTERGSLVLYEAAADLEQAHGQLTKPLGQPSRAVPIVAQNRETVVVVLDGAADAATAAASALADQKPLSLGQRCRDGRRDGCHAWRAARCGGGGADGVPAIFG